MNKSFKRTVYLTRKVERIVHEEIEIEVVVSHYAGACQTLTDQGEPEETKIESSIDVGPNRGDDVELEDDEVREAIKLAFDEHRQDEADAEWERRYGDDNDKPF